MLTQRAHLQPVLLLVLANHGGSLSRQDALNAMGVFLGDALSDEDRIPMKDRPTEDGWMNRASWAVADMKEEGLMLPTVNAGTGNWTLTDAGLLAAKSLKDGVLAGAGSESAERSHGVPNGGAGAPKHGGLLPDSLAEVAALVSAHLGIVDVLSVEIALTIGRSTAERDARWADEDAKVAAVTPLLSDALADAIRVEMMSRRDAERAGQPLDTEQVRAQILRARAVPTEH